MRYLLILILSVLGIAAHSQQINPVPDYIFRNQMSVGRNTFTDTAAYMSIGPRYGAVKGFMPPIVTDTNAVTGVKRNGLLIFSIQLNNFAYWDSTTARFRKITAEASVDSLIFATRAYRQKGDDSLGAIISVRTDTGLLSTKAYRQKGIDSVVTLISTLGGGTVLSVGSGYGTNFPTITTSGSIVVDSNVVTSKASRDKLKDSLNANIALKVNISDTATMLGAYLRKADTTAMLTPYLRKVDTTAMLGDYVRVAGFGLVKGTQTLSTDTAAMATRSRVQKGLDSVAALVAAPDSLIFSTRAWRQKGDDSLGVIIGTKATATGTTNYLSKFTGTSALGNSIVYATTSEVGISTPSPTHTLDVNGRTRIRTIDSTSTGMNMLYSDADGVIKKAAIPAGGSGTVTSVGTGFGLSGGTITTTGTLLVDSASIATRARVQKGIDSLGAVKQNVLTNPVTGTGTTNYVPKWTGISTQGNSAIFSTDSANVFIGQTSDGLTDANRTLFGIKGATNSMISMRYGSTLGGYIWAQSGTFSFNANNTALTFNTGSGGGSERMRIFNSGTVAINSTTDNSYQLDVNGTLRNTTGAAFATSSGNVLIGTTTDASIKLDVAGNMRSTLGASFATSSGNVGIGVTSPTQKLHVAGSVLITNTNALQFLNSTGTNRPVITFFSDNNVYFDAEDGVQIYRTGGTERARLTSTGYGIGNITPSERLDVNGRARIRTIDSTSTAMNILYADATGVIKKAAVPSGGSGTVTSVATGFGLSGGTITTTGTLIVDSASVATRARVQKGVDSVAAIAVKGAGITGYFPKWTGTGTQDTSQLFQLGANIGIGTASPTYRLHLPDAGSTANQAMIAGTIFGSDGNGITISPNSSNITIKGGQGNGSIYSGTISSVARWGINTTSISDAVLSINGDVKIVTVDSTSTARNMLYQDANGVIKKSAGLSMSDDVMTASGSWVVTKDAGSGYSINNVAYTTNGTTKMVTIDGAFYIAEASFSDAAWNDVATIPAGFRPQKTVNWTNNFIVSGAEYETSGGTDFTGALSWTYAQMRVTDEGKVQVNASISSNSIAAGGTDYVVIQFTQSYIIK